MHRSVTSTWCWPFCTSTQSLMKYLIVIQNCILNSIWLCGCYIRCCKSTYKPIGFRMLVWCSWVSGYKTTNYWTLVGPLYQLATPDIWCNYVINPWAVCYATSCVSPADGFKPLVLCATEPTNIFVDPFTGWVCFFACCLPGGPCPSWWAANTSRS